MLGVLSCNNFGFLSQWLGYSGVVYNWVGIILQAIRTWYLSKLWWHSSAPSSSCVLVLLFSGKSLHALSQVVCETVGSGWCQWTWCRCLQHAGVLWWHVVMHGPGLKPSSPEARPYIGQAKPGPPCRLEQAYGLALVSSKPGPISYSHGAWVQTLTLLFTLLSALLPQLAFTSDLKCFDSHPMAIIGSDDESAPTVHQHPQQVIVLSSRLTNSNNNAMLELCSHWMTAMKHATDKASINVNDSLALDHMDDKGTTVPKGMWNISLLQAAVQNLTATFFFIPTCTYHSQETALCWRRCRRMCRPDRRQQMCW